VYFFVTIPSYSNPTIHKIWIGENLEYWSLEKKNVSFENCGMIFNNCKLIHKDTTFTIRKYFWKAGKIARQHEDYIYRILKLTNDTLIISPENQEAARLINNRQTYTFTDKNNFYKDNLKFHKLFFSGHNPMTFSPKITLEIDSLGQIFVFSEPIPHFEKPNDLKGLYKGQLSNKQLADLILLLKRSKLDMLSGDLGIIIDGTYYNFKFHYDNKVIEGKGCNIPHINKPLFDFLRTIHEDIKLEKLDGNYDFNQF